MSRFEDITGQKFNRLTAIERITNDSRKNTRWLCKCDCGKESIAVLSHLKSGHTKSCGCYQKDVVTIHGYSRTQAHNTWKMMMKRCQDQSFKCYPNYGGRGITVCDEWHDFPVFKEWADKNGCEKGLTIERLDVNGNYEPSNCKWIPASEQASNKRNSLFVEFNGEKITVKELSRRVGKAYHKLVYAYHKGTLQEML